MDNVVEALKKQANKDQFIKILEMGDVDVQNVIID